MQEKNREARRRQDVLEVLRSGERPGARGRRCGARGLAFSLLCLAAQTPAPALAADAKEHFGQTTYAVIFTPSAANGSLRMEARLASRSHDHYDHLCPVESWDAAAPGSRRAPCAWTSNAQDQDQGGIFARRIGQDGLPEGPEIQVNEYAIGRQDLSRVVVAPKGDFVVAWTSWGQDGDDAGVYARRLDRKGNALGPDLG